MSQKSALKIVLLGLIPYTRENLLLSFSPNKFFNELEKASKYKRSTLKNAYSNAKSRGYVVMDGELPVLSAAGKRMIRPFTPKNFKTHNAQLMVIFDIPEYLALSRRKLRWTLKQWQFKQVQKSVWISDKDYVEHLKDLLLELRLLEFVEVHETVRRYPS